MEFKIRYDKSVFLKSDAELFEDIMGFVLENLIHKSWFERTYADIILDLKSEDLYSSFCDLLHCISLIKQKINFDVDDYYDGISDYSFEDVFSCTTKELFRGIIKLLISGLNLNISWNDENLKIAYNCFLNDLLDAFGTRSYFKAQDLLAELKLSEDEFRDLLPDKTKKVFDYIIESAKEYADYDFTDLEQVNEIFIEFSNCVDDINWLKVYDNYCKSKK